MDGSQAWTAGGTEEAVVADFMESRREDVLEKPAYKFVGDERHTSPAVVSGVLVAERNVSVIDGEYSAIGYGGAMDVAREILKHPLRSLDTGLGVGDPGLFPDG